MTITEAKQILKYHSLIDEDVHHPKMKRGFLGMLRPFSGELNEANYHEVIKALMAVADELRERNKVDKEIISALWGICYLSRSWGLEKESMLRSNKLINDLQIKRLEAWINSISYATMMILDGSDNAEAFIYYEPK